jgi:hypothetical protein
MAECKGNIVNDHCCWVDGKICPFLKHYPNEERIWSCGIREKYDSWEEVYSDKDYVDNVKPLLVKIDLPDCGKWPRKNEKCTVCGLIG